MESKPTANIVIDNNVSLPHEIVMDFCLCRSVLYRQLILNEITAAVERMLILS